MGGIVRVGEESDEDACAIALRDGAENELASYHEAQRRECQGLYCSAQARQLVSSWGAVSRQASCDHRVFGRT